MIFVDTSALFALLDEDDSNHRSAAEWFSGPGRAARSPLVTHNYVLVETSALVQRRLGSEALKTFFDAFVPAMTVRFVDESLHRIAVAAHLAAGGKRPSLVDWVSFELMRDRGIHSAFAFDRDFSVEGFETLP